MQYLKTYISFNLVHLCKCLEFRPSFPLFRFKTLVKGKSKPNHINETNDIKV